MKPTIDDLAVARRSARAQFFAAIADARTQLSPASLTAYAKARVQTRTRNVASATFKRAAAHRGLIAGTLAAGIVMLLVAIFWKPTPTAQRETDHDQ